MPNRRYNKQVAQPLKNGGRAKAMGGGMMRRDMRFGSKAKKSGKINR